MAVVIGMAFSLSSLKINGLLCDEPSSFYLFYGVLRMKNVFKKGLVVLLASLFVTTVFAADEATTAAAPAAEAAAPAAKAEAAKAAPAAKAKAMHKAVSKKHVVKHCWKNKSGKMVCKKMMHVMPAKKAAAK
jgi:hypothetical protein